MTDIPFDLPYFRDIVVDFIAAPVALPATDIEEDRFIAHWEEVVEAVSYELDVSTDPSFGDLVTPGGFPMGLEAGTLQALVTGLAPETTHYYRIRAVKVTGTSSANSNTISLETLELFTGQGGDLVTYDGTYSRHFFETPGAADFEVLTGFRRTRRLLVGGGGQGGGVNGTGVSCGGGGGGGVLDLQEADRDPMAVGVYPVVVGEGGNTPAALNVGEDGGNSTFDGDTALGGGHGGGASASVGNGGSGGGAWNSAGVEFGGIGTPGQGFDGGDCPTGFGGGGAGGGGASEAGENGSLAGGGDGGDAVVSDISSEDVLYGAGGGGAVPVDPFGPIGGTGPGVGGAGGGGNGRGGSYGPGGAATGIGAGGGGAIGNSPGGVGTDGTVIIKYKGRAVDITPPPVEPVYHGPITMDGCTRDQEVDGVEILVDCNARIDSGIFPDFQKYVCVGGGVLRSSRSYRASSLPSQIPDSGVLGEHDITNGTLVFRFSEPIRAFKITRLVTSGTDSAPILLACDDYTVIPHPTSAIPGSSKDGSIIGVIQRSPELVYFPTQHLEPPVNLAAEEVMEVSHPAGFTCVVITQFTKFPSEFIDPFFVLLAD